MKLTRFSKQPVLAPEPGHDWEDLVVTNPAAFHDEKTGKVYLLYRRRRKRPPLYRASRTGGKFRRLSLHPFVRPPGSLSAGRFCRRRRRGRPAAGEIRGMVLSHLCLPSLRQRAVLAETVGKKVPLYSGSRSAGTVVQQWHEYGNRIFQRPAQLDPGGVHHGTGA